MEQFFGIDLGRGIVCFIELQLHGSYDSLEMAHLLIFVFPRLLAIVDDLYTIVIVF